MFTIINIILRKFFFISFAIVENSLFGTNNYRSAESRFDDHGRRPKLVVRVAVSRDDR